MAWCCDWKKSRSRQPARDRLRSVLWTTRSTFIRKIRRRGRCARLCRLLGAKRFDVLTRFVPKSFQNKLTPELLRERFASEPRIVAQVEALRKHLDEPVTIDGNTARLPLGPEQEATLLLQDGRWRVQKLE